MSALVRSISFSDRDCEEVFKADLPLPGIYDIEIRLGVTAKVKCTEEGWTVFQSRGQFGNSADYFNRNWKAYAEGFGVPGM